MTKLHASAFLVFGALTFGPSAAGSASLHPVRTVTIENMKFVPETITVAKGDVIVWKNQDIVPHTVTGNDRAFDSKPIQPGKNFRYQAKRTGDFSYSCLFHPTNRRTQ